MRVVVDFVSFDDSQGRAIIKELAVVSVGENRCTHFVVKPPFNWSELHDDARTSNAVTTTSVHGIKWEDGWVSHADMPKALGSAVERATAIYSYGASKCSVLQKLLKRAVIDMEAEFQAPKANCIGFAGQSCLLPCHRVRTLTCALRNASVHAKWLKYYIDKLKTENLCSCSQLKEDLE